MADDEADEWRFSIDEVGPDEEDRDEREAGGGQDTDATRDGDEDSDAWRVTVGEDNDGPTVAVGGPERAAEEPGEDDGNVAGTLAPGSPVEPGTPWTRRPSGPSPASSCSGPPPCMRSSGGSDAAGCNFAKIFVAPGRRYFPDLQPAV
ncbi:hypothetical protein BRC67_07560 [Halobacteriales archaeon QH_3_68_24]|nr:MAG: hypothetical protein BRC67_07560 [Halobacteriales archaeon QH_3_68_24]